MDLPEKDKKSMHSNHSTHTSSSITEDYYSFINSETSKSFTLSQHTNVSHISSDTDNDEDYNWKQLLKSYIVTSTSLSKNKDNQCNEKSKHFNHSKSPEHVQMKMNSKMVLEKTERYLDTLKNDLLQFTKNYMHKPDNESKNLIEKFKNILTPKINTCDSTLLNKRNYNVTTQFVDIDTTSLNSLNNKLKYVQKIKELIKLSPSDKILKDQSDDEKCVRQLDIQRYDFGNCGLSSDYVNDSRLPEPTFNLDSNEILQNNTKTTSFEDIRELNKTSLPSPQHNSILFDQSFQELSVQNYSLNCIDNASNKEVSEMAVSDVKLSCNDLPNIDNLVNNTHSSNSKLRNHSDDRVEKNQNRYWLRKHRNLIQRYSAPLNSIKKLKKRKPIINKDTVILLESSNKGGMLYQYKYDKTLAIDSRELIKYIMSS